MQGLFKINRKEWIVFISGGAFFAALIMALDNAGFDVLAILGGLGIGGLAFALAAQDSVANFFGSVAIFIDKPFRVGDRVQVQGYDGVVTAALRAVDEVLSILPASELPEQLSPEIQGLVRERDEARAKKDFAAADRIRDDLAARGYLIDDLPTGTRVRRKS